MIELQKIMKHWNEMKTTLLSVFTLIVMLIPAAHAEGIASMTNVTAENGKSLEHHGLAVICKSQEGKTFVDLIFRAEKETPFTSCSITVYDQSGKKILLQIDPEIQRAGKIKGLPEGKRIYFHIADEFLDQVEIMYHLHANKFQSHVFRIQQGQLSKLAKLPQ